MPFVVDVECRCGHIRTLWLRSRDATPDDDDQCCPECGSYVFTRLVGKTAYHKSNDPEARSAMLKKRSEDHSRANFKDNLERAKDQAAKRGFRL